MNSPITGKPMRLMREKRFIPFRKEDYEIDFHFGLCEDTGEQFEDERQAELNISQVYNQYRAKHNMPTTDEIRRIREMYGISASKMSDVLGFGANQYRQYETGEIPSISNGRLIMQAADPEDFLKMVKSATFELGQDFAQQLKQTIEEKIRMKAIDLSVDYSERMSELTGFKRLSVQKLWNMIIFFSERIQPFKVKLNKLLFYSDFYHFKLYGSSISGTSYRAIQYGPVPSDYQILMAQGVMSGILELKTIEMYDFNGEQFLGKIDFQKKLFTEEEIDVLQQVAEKFAESNNQQIIKISHLEKAWIECEQTHSLIDYRYAFDLLAI